MVLHRTPVSVYVAETDRHVTLKRGDELADSDPICRDKTLAWLFRDEPEQVKREAVPVEDASAVPGRRRPTRRL